MSTSAANETTAESPKEKPTLNHNAHNEEEMFSPTSAAALALSTLHHFGDQQRPSTASLKATRLFNNSESQEIPEKSPQYYSSPGPYPPLHPSYYGHFGMWSRGDAPSNKPPSMASHWSYPYPSATSYPVEVSVV